MLKVLLLSIGMFALGMDAYVLAGLIPLMESDFHISASQAGQAVSVFTLCYALSAPIFATFLAGKPIRSILLIALAVFTLANAATALASSFPLLLLARAAAGIGAGLYSPLAAAAAAALVAPERRGRSLGTILGGMSMGTVVGVPIGLYIAGLTGWRGTLWAITIVGAAALAGIAARFPDVPAAAPPSLSQRLRMLANGRLAAVVGITFLTSIASLGLYTYVTAILQDSAAPLSVTGYLWAWGLGGVIGSFSIGALIDRTHKPGALMAGILAIMTVAMLALPLGVPRIGLLGVIPFFLWGMTGWSSQAPQQHVLLRLQPQHGPAAVALNSSANYLGSSVGAMLGGGILLGGFSPSHLPYLAGAIALAALLGQGLILWNGAAGRHKSIGLKEPGKEA